MRVHIVLLAALALVSPPLAAQDEAMDTTITRGGRWSLEGRTGWYRIRVITGGIEHIVSNVEVDWVSSDGTTLSHCRVDLPSVRLDSAKLGSDDSRQWVATLIATPTHGEESRTGIVLLRLGSPVAARAWMAWRGDSLTAVGDRWPC